MENQLKISNLSTSNIDAVATEDISKNKSRFDQRTSGKKCDYPLCNNTRRNTNNTKFFCFPKNPNKCKEWCNIVGKNFDDFKKIWFICDAHFNLNDIGSRKLKKNALPIKPSAIALMQSKSLQFSVDDVVFTPAVDDSLPKVSDSLPKFSEIISNARLNGVKCVYPRCDKNKRNSNDISFFKFPSNPKRFTEWCNIIGVPENDVITSTWCICENHFNPKYVGKNTLLGNAAPIMPTLLSTIHTIKYMNVENIEKEIPVVKIESKDEANTITVKLESELPHIEPPQFIAVHEPIDNEIAEKIETTNVEKIDTTNVIPKNNCEKCAQLLQELKMLESRKIVYNLREKYKLQKKTLRKKNKLMNNLMEKLKLEKYQYKLLKKVAEQQAELVKNWTASDRRKTIAKDILNIIKIKKQPKNTEFVTVYTVS